MNDRERFLATMRYQDRDRPPLFDFSFWDETVELWKTQGLPRHLDRKSASDYLGMDPFWNGVGPTDLSPAFEAGVLEDRGDQEVLQQSDGVRVLRHKRMGSIPLPLEHLLKDRESWEKHFRWRLDPDHPSRWENWDARVAALKEKGKTQPVHVGGGSLYGKLRDWMGVEALSMLVYDDPALFEEMVTTCADCVVGVVKRVCESGIPLVGCGMWEDMCYNAGPLLSPAHVKQYLMPHYRRIVDLLHSYGVDLIWLDCDGKIDDLMGLWLDAGINCMFPLEIGTWGADPVRYRKEYGKDLLMMGGFDKHILARTPEEVRAEVRRLAPVVEEGGYIPFCDHRVPPDVPLQNYLAYLEEAREVWCHGVNLKPMGPIDLKAAGDAVE